MGRLELVQDLVDLVTQIAGRAGSGRLAADHVWK